MRNVCAAFACIYSLAVSASPLALDDNPFVYPIYAGGLVGYGSTTWFGLVPSPEKQNLAIGLSAPTEAQEGGTVWGGFAGYEINQFFAFEVNYQHFPATTLTFDEMSLFAFENKDKTSLITQTEVVFGLAKIMLVIPNTSARIYSAAGVADLHRHDELKDTWIVTPSFSVGANYTIAQHWMAELSANYTAGYGESEINPVDDFIPFLYSVHAKLAYRFN